LDNTSPFFRRRRTRDNASAIAVIGLGRFGGALAVELTRSGTEVLGIDSDEDIVQSLNGVLTHVVRADSTKQAALEQLGEEPGACVAIEDNVGGIQAANAAGVPSVAFPNENTAGHDFSAASGTLEQLTLVDLQEYLAAS
jgi:UDP-N-acetyl-D-mannosaminuronate dehydrogenase